MEFLTGSGDGEIVLTSSIIGFLFICVPALSLFIRYVVINKKTEVEYKEKSINLFIGGYAKVIDISSIENVEIRVSLPVFYNGFRYFPTDSYFYAVIYLKSKEKFVVTSLIDNELIETINYFKDKVKVNRKWSFICWPPAHKLNC
jgi:hypothetical protein